MALSLLPPEKSSVLLVAEQLRPGGMASYAEDLLGGLPALGVSPRLITPEPPPQGSFTVKDEDSLKVFPGLLKLWYRPILKLSILNWTRPWQPALIHGLSAFTEPTCRDLSAALRIPYVLSVQHFQARGALKPGANCKRILACGEAIRENLVNDARVPKELIRVVALGVDAPPETELSLPAAPEAPPDQQVFPRRQLITTFAPLAASQDVGTFLRAARIVEDRLPGRAWFMVVGEGPEESRLFALCRQLQLEKHIVFSHAGVSHDKILKDTDIYVQNAKQEGLGYGVLEAMSWARPVIASSVGGLIPLVREGETGFLVPPGDPAALAEKMVQLLNQPELRIKLGAAARAQALERHSRQRMISRTVEAYAAALGFNVSKTTTILRAVH
jgi:glycosyltransferase involved in cell wall biosynthesis